MYACDSLPIGENGMEKFLSVLEIQRGAAFASPAVNATKNGPLFNEGWGRGVKLIQYGSGGVRLSGVVF